MSTTDTSVAVDGCRPTDDTPVDIDADALDSTADAYLRSLKRDLADAGYVPASLVVEADFEVDCSLTTQAEVDRIREYLHVARFLGAGTVRLDVGRVTDPTKVQPAISALEERAERDGLTLVVRNPEALTI